MNEKRVWRKKYSQEPRKISGIRRYNVFQWIHAHMHKGKVIAAIQKVDLSQKERNVRRASAYRCWEHHGWL